MYLYFILYIYIYIYIFVQFLKIFHMVIWYQVFLSNFQNFQTDQFDS